ncbi:receptor-like protein kinase-like [Dorcoceras hygrometricum]|uniref:non-specific serine/threonine protein kinase n=1 Tax=Dorcoceras hygrometricum TaxID=472368 RepID=A0A2Z7AK30_9LAMI|nr:receptor-like protein kinase-like [Dorcoceras hygrometricum]
MASRQPSPPDSRAKTSIIFLAITISASLLIVLAILYILYRFWYSLVHRSRTSPYYSASPWNKLKNFTYRELKNATNNFSESHTIGRGGSGIVFRGILKDGKLVAVKLLDSTSLQCEQEFQNELKVLGGLKCSFLVCLLGFCVDKGKRLVVYEYMPNKSLQESLFVESGVSFLASECEPAVIHGDVKPSNVLLDSEFRAKLSDFGLSRMKLEEEFGVDLYSQDLGKSQELWKSRELSDNLNAGGVAGEEVDFALALQASSLQTSGKIHHSDSRGCNVKGKELLSDHNGGDDCDKFMPYDYDLNDMDQSKDLASYDEDNNNVCVGMKQWGKDWWWRQDGSGELCSKDYEQANLDSCKTRDKFGEATVKPVKEHGIVYTNTVIENDERKGTEMSQPVCTTKNRKMHEWWKEERLRELDVKNHDQNMIQERRNKWLRVPHFGLGKSFHFRRKQKLGHEKHKVVNKHLEFSFREGWRKKKARSTASDMWSGDVFSHELSSTTSMRGTLCYVAPEFSGSCGYLMEKADIYSLGVLILVIVSGRRPLHVLSSPMKPEKANLVSWSRLLARSGSLLDLVDERLNGQYNKEQASLCVNLALSCIQKMPELRPDAGDIVKILNGEMELLPPPFDFSPSPTSRRRHRSNAAH